MTPEAALSLVTSSYYRGVADEVVVEALRYWLGSLESAGWPQHSRSATLMYAFCRIGRATPSARSAMTALGRTLSGRSAEVVREIIAASSSAQFPNVCNYAVSKPEQLDLLWADFFVTGSKEPVLCIIRVLDQPDAIRRLLDVWLQERTWFGGTAREATAQTLASHGLVVDLKARRIVTEGDLDCFCFGLAEQKIPILKLLPVQLPPSDLASFAVKGTALWSLRLNSLEHDLVQQLCQEEQQRSGGAARRQLLEPLPSQKPFAL